MSGKQAPQTPQTPKTPQNKPQASPAGTMSPLNIGSPAVKPAPSTPTPSSSGSKKK